MLGTVIIFLRDQDRVPRICFIHVFDNQLMDNCLQCRKHVVKAHGGQYFAVVFVVYGEVRSLRLVIMRHWREIVAVIDIQHYATEELLMFL